MGKIFTDPSVISCLNHWDIYSRHPKYSINY
jgi:hypothetical protein